MFGTFSHAPELIIILIIALVIFGPKKLPDLGKGLGQGIKEFRKATTGETDKDNKTDASASATQASAAANEPEATKEGSAASPQAPIETKSA